jgi:class 3 adenylate cyclase
MSLLPFVPRLALSLLHDGVAVPAGHPRVRSTQASVLLADVSGFTGLVDRIAGRYGDRGAERLQGILNDCFGPLTDLVDGSGGEVLAFPGDAALAIWMSEDPEQNPGDTGAAQRSMRAATARSAGPEPFAGRRRAPPAELRSGRPVRAALVGGVNDHWDTVMLGDAIEQLGDPLNAARPGEVVLSGAAWALCGPSVEGDRRGSHLLVRGTTPPASRAPGPPPRAGRFPIRSSDPWSQRRCAPGSTPASTPGWLNSAPSRRCSSISTAHDPAHALHASIRLIQEVVSRFEGTSSRSWPMRKG